MSVVSEAVLFQARFPAAATETVWVSGAAAAARAAAKVRFEDTPASNIPELPHVTVCSAAHQDHPVSPAASVSVSVIGPDAGSVPMVRTSTV